MNRETKSLLKDIRFTLYQYEDKIIDCEQLRDILNEILNNSIARKTL